MRGQAGKVCDSLRAGPRRPVNVLQLHKGDYPENSRVVFCPNKISYVTDFEPVMCLDQWKLGLRIYSSD